MEAIVQTSISDVNPVLCPECDGNPKGCIHCDHGYVPKVVLNLFIQKGSSIEYFLITLLVLVMLFANNPQLNAIRQFLIINTQDIYHLQIVLGIILGGMLSFYIASIKNEVQDNTLNQWARLTLEEKRAKYENIKKGRILPFNTFFASFLVFPLPYLFLICTVLIAKISMGYDISSLSDESTQQYAIICFATLFPGGGILLIAMLLASATDTKTKNKKDVIKYSQLWPKNRERLKDVYRRISYS